MHMYAGVAIRDGTTMWRRAEEGDMEIRTESKNLGDKFDQWSSSLAEISMDFDDQSAITRKLSQINPQAANIIHGNTYVLEDCMRIEGMIFDLTDWTPNVEVWSERARRQFCVEIVSLSENCASQ